MLRELACAMLAACICLRVSEGQIFFNNDQPFSFETPGAPDPNFMQDSTPSAPLNNRNNLENRMQPITTFSEEAFPLSGSSLTISSTNLFSSIANPSPVEEFVSVFKSAVFASKVLPDVFDLREISPETFRKVLYDSIIENIDGAGHSNPYNVASVATIGINEGIDVFTLPIVLDIYSYSIAKYLFDKGILNSSNASSLAKKYAEIMEISAKRNFKKEIPESKVLALSRGYADYMTCIDKFNIETFDDLVIYFAKEVKRFTDKSASALNFMQDSTPSAPLNNRNNLENRMQPITTFSKEAFPLSGSSLAISSANLFSPIANPSPVEEFVSVFKSAVFTSKVLPDVFDLREISPETFRKVLYDGIIESIDGAGHSNPQNVASVATIGINEGLFTLPIVLDMYSYSIAKYLFDKGILNSSNASSLAKKYAEIMEISAKRNFKKEIPESKILALSRGYADFMTSIDRFNIETFDDQAIYFANEVKRITDKSLHLFIPMHNGWHRYTSQ